MARSHSPDVLCIMQTALSKHSSSKDFSGTSGKRKPWELANPGSPLIQFKQVSSSAVRSWHLLCDSLLLSSHLLNAAACHTCITKTSVGSLSWLDYCLCVCLCVCVCVGVCTVSDASHSDVSWWSSYRDACAQSHVLSALVMALVGRSIVTESDSKTSVITVIMIKCSHAACSCFATVFGRCGARGNPLLSLHFPIFYSIF